MKTVSILGSTGSIGAQALEVIRAHREQFSVYALVAGSNAEKLIEQAKEFAPRVVGIVDERKAELIRRALPQVELIFGKDAAKLAAQHEVDICLCAIVGMAGMDSFLESLKHAQKVGLANKESLVCAGTLVEDYSKIVPVDSEHSAIFQCLQGEAAPGVAKLILTASGGPFRELPIEKFADITIKDALSHPNWRMGEKISIDSATMMNKGLEVIEATHLFGVPPSQIEVVVHKESIIHSMVEFADGSIKAQLSAPDMRLPIHYALFYPQRTPSSVCPKLDLVATQSLHFDAPNIHRFPCLKLAYEAIELGGIALTVLNAANEAAVALFLNKKIQFIDIPKLVEYGLRNLEEVPVNVENIHRVHDQTITTLLKNFGRITN